MAQIIVDGYYGPYNWNKGGGGTLVTSGTFDSATVQLEYSLDQGTTWTSYAGLVQTAPGVSPFNIYAGVQLRVDVSGGGGSMDFFLQVNESDGATNLGAISVSGTGLATEATALASDAKLGTIDTDTGNIATDVAELKELSFGNNGITVLKSGTTTETATFRGIQVISDMAVVDITGSNAGTDLDGVTLGVGYHPVSGTEIDVTGNTGLAYLIHE